MHEMPIAQAIVDQAVQAVAPHGATRIDAIEVEIGRMRQIVPEALQVAFTATSEGTIASGARLEITEIEMIARCLRCGEQFTPEIALYVCPACGQADVQVVAGNDMILKSITARTPEDEASS